LPPEIRIAARTNDLTAFQEGGVAVLRWSYPSLTTAGGALTDVEAIEVWQLSLPLAQEPPKPVTPQDRAVRRQLVENQGEVLATLDPTALAELTRGSSLVYRDDLDRWRQEAGAVADSMVVWYGVRTVCCRGRESELSNIARLRPQTPPDPPPDLRLAAGSAGIDLEWTQASDLLTLVERSPDGESWREVSPEDVQGGQWRDTSAAQGRSWSYRLRSVRVEAPAERVVGPPSLPVRVDHPDTYPPGIPEGVVCLPEGERVRVRWRAVPGAVLYRVSRTREAGSAKVLTDTHRQLEFTDPAAPLGSLTYLVTAIDKAGNESEPAKCSVVMGEAP
jgi:hypothetical protein